MISNPKALVIRRFFQPPTEDSLLSFLVYDIMLGVHSTALKALNI